MINAETDFFIENLSLLLRSNMPVSEALQSVGSEVRSKKLLKMIAKIQSEVDSGANISESLERSGLLSKRFVSLIKIGEETGKLSDQLSLVVEDQKKEKLFKSKIRSALIYPGFVLLVTFVVGLVVVWYIFPKLVVVFASIGGTLPLTTRIIINVGNFFKDHGLIVVPSVIVVSSLAFFFLFVWEKTKIVGEQILMFFPITKTIIQEIELARFGYVMSTLLASGITMPQALESVKDSSSFVIYKRFYQSIYEKVSDGNSLYRSMTLYPGYSRLMPQHIARLLLAGELSGSLSDTLAVVSDSYEKKLDSLTRDMSALLEPVIVVFVGLIVAVIAFGIISPIYGLVNQLN